MAKSLKMILAAILFLLLLPYFITNFFSAETRKEYALQTATRNFISVRADGEIREIAFEDYVMGVAAKQIDTNMQIETLKAQMVITRTNLMKHLEQVPGELLAEAYLTQEELQQKGSANKLMQAAEETKGQVLNVDGNLIFAPYHAISSGSTRSGEVMQGDYTWLKAVESAQDVEAESYLYVELIAPGKIRDSIQAAFPGALTDDPLLPQLEVTKRDNSNYVLTVRVGSENISGEKLREVLGLNSSCLYIEETDGKIRVTTKGLGHGLGLSQYGANKMAAAGQNYAAILQYYFPECIIV